MEEDDDRDYLDDEEKEKELEREKELLKEKELQKDIERRLAKEREKEKQKNKNNKLELDNLTKNEFQKLLKESEGTLLSQQVTPRNDSYRPRKKTIKQQQQELDTPTSKKSKDGLTKEKDEKIVIQTPIKRKKTKKYTTITEDMLLKKEKV